MYSFLSTECQSSRPPASFSQIAKRFPNLMVKLLVRASTNPVVRLEPGRVAVQANGTVTAYAIQANGTLTPLFMLNLVRASRQPNNKWAAFVQFWFWGKEENLQKKPGDLDLISLPFFSWQETNISAQVLLKGMRLAAAVTLNRWVTLLKKKMLLRKTHWGGQKVTIWLFRVFFFLQQNVSDPGHQLCRRFSGESSFFVVIIHSFIYLFGTEPWRKDQLWPLFSISSKPIFGANKWQSELWADWPLTSTPPHPPLGQSSGQRPPNGAQTGGDTDGKWWGAKKFLKLRNFKILNKCKKTNCHFFFFLHFAVQLAKGYPLPALGKMELVDTQLQIYKVWIAIGSFLKKNYETTKTIKFGKIETWLTVCLLQDFLLIGTDVGFTAWTVWKLPAAFHQSGQEAVFFPL